MSDFQRVWEQIDFDPLFEEIVPAESTVSFYNTKVEVKLKKKSAGKWDALEADANAKPLDELTEEVSFFPPPPYPHPLVLLFSEVCCCVSGRKLTACGAGDQAAERLLPLEQGAGRGGEELGQDCGRASGG